MANVDRPTFLRLNLSLHLPSSPSPVGRPPASSVLEVEVLSIDPDGGTQGK